MDGGSAIIFLLPAEGLKGGSRAQSHNARALTRWDERFSFSGSDSTRTRQGSGTGKKGLVRDIPR